MAHDKDTLAHQAQQHMQRTEEILQCVDLQLRHHLDDLGKRAGFEDGPLLLAMVHQDVQALDEVVKAHPVVAQLLDERKRTQPGCLGLSLSMIAARFDAVGVMSWLQEQGADVLGVRRKKVPHLGHRQERYWLFPLEEALFWSARTVLSCWAQCHGTAFLRQPNPADIAPAALLVSSRRPEMLMHLFELDPALAEEPTRYRGRQLSLEALSIELKQPQTVEMVRSWRAQRAARQALHERTMAP